MDVPTTNYVDAADGMQIAYQVFGDRNIDFVYLTGTISNVDMRWEDPEISEFLERLASFSRVITFDRRGVGASERFSSGSVPSWEGWAEDLTVILDAAHSERATLFAVGDDAGRMGITFAATHPERVRSLILFNALGHAPGHDGDLARSIDEFADYVAERWGTEEFVGAICPSVVHDRARTAWWARYMRATASPKSMAAQTRANKTDVSFVLPSLRVPTLVMHRTERVRVSIDSARALANRIPDARFVEIPGTDVPPTTQNAAQILSVLEEFVTGTGPELTPDRFLATVLFTDIVDSTGLAARLGDHAWRQLLDAHDRMVRSALQRFHGQEIATTGDGFLATFDAPGRAIHCGRAICDGARDLDIEVRAGLHTGEVEARGRDIGGVSVHIGARVAAAAQGNEVLVSRTVTDLVAGSGIAFEDRGEHELKGVPGRWHLYSVRG
jgi:class 3 adenylate cyclase